jgi:universal stress protein E
MSRVVFAVVDPTTDHQRALKRAIYIVKNYNTGDDRVHAYLCASSHSDADDQEALERAEISRHQLWLDKLLDEMNTDGVQITTEVVWDTDWREALAPAAEAAGAWMIIKSTYRRSPGRRRLMKTSDWRLLRTTKVPVLLLKKDQISDSGRVLLALNVNAKDEAHKLLNQRIVEFGKTISATGNFELYAVNAYQNSTHFVHPPDLAKLAGVDTQHALSVEGTPEAAIAEVVNSIDAELVIIGTVARRGITGATLGNTVERVLDNVDADLLTIVNHD